MKYKGITYHIDAEHTFEKNKISQWAVKADNDFKINILQCDYSLYY
jgi:hypothetical protein